MCLQSQRAWWITLSWGYSHSWKVILSQAMPSVLGPTALDSVALAIGQSSLPFIGQCQAVPDRDATQQGNQRQERPPFTAACLVLSQSRACPFPAALPPVTERESWATFPSTSEAQSQGRLITRIHFLNLTA